MAPSQKDNKRAKIPLFKPKNQPMPNANLASPKPIALPLLKSQIKAKNAKKHKPAKKFVIRNS